MNEGTRSSGAHEDPVEVLSVRIRQCDKVGHGVELAQLFLYSLVTVAPAEVQSHVHMMVSNKYRQ